MKMAKPLIAAVPLTLVLIVAVLVVVGVTPGAFGFHAWPEAPAAGPHTRVIAVDEPVSATAPRAERHLNTDQPSPPAPRLVAKAPRSGSPDAVGGSKQQPSAETPPVPAPATPAAPAEAPVVEARQPVDDRLPVDVPALPLDVQDPHHGMK
jgi:hypothetical protein